MAEKKSFEQAMTELEATVAALEAGHVPLEEALSLFEKGIKLSKNCQQLLDKAEMKVKRLTETADGQIEEEDFT